MKFKHFAPARFEGGWIWCRANPANPQYSDRFRHVLEAKVFDKLTAGQYRSADENEDVYATRWYTTNQEAFADWRQATGCEGEP